MENSEKQMPFLTNSKQMMLEFIRKSKRLTAMDEILDMFSTLEIQKVYMGVFNSKERKYLENHFRLQGVRKLLKTSMEGQEKLPENWFRKQ